MSTAEAHSRTGSMASTPQPLVILLGGGSKKRQQRDIADAISLWSEYKKSHRTER
jgi:hypothetical protein